MNDPTQAGSDPVTKAVHDIELAERHLEVAREEEHEAEAELKGAVEELAQAEHQSTQIIINGRRRAVPGKVVTYAEVVHIAYPVPNPDPNIIYAVTFIDAAQHPSSGDLAAGGSVKVKDGTIFNVVEATKS